MPEAEFDGHPIPIFHKLQIIAEDAMVKGLTTHGAAIVQDLHRVQIIVIIAFLDVIINIIKTETPGVSGIGVINHEP